MSRLSFLRIIDANYNRAKEALRVCEDIARFLMNDSRLTARFKRCRHELTRILLKLPVPYRKLVKSRDSRQDVGRSSQIRDRRGKPSWKDLMAANLKRGEEATRVLEEFAKMWAPVQASAFQKLRFRLYELEKACFRKF